MTKIRVRRLTYVISSALFAVTLSSPGVAGDPGAAITTPHGEQGRINRSNGEVTISYEFVAAPGAPHTPAVFKVFRPRTDPPDGLPKPRIGAGDAGSWAFIGEGSLAYMSAMMDLDANGIVTWTFMTPDKLEKYRVPGAPTPTAQTSPAADDRPPGWKARDPNFPDYRADGVIFAKNDLGARMVRYNYANDQPQPFQIWIEINNRNVQFAYIGFNEDGAWLNAVDIDPKRLFVLKGGVHIAAPDVFDCQNGSGTCWAGAVLTRKPYSTPLPGNLRNSGEGTLAYYKGKFGNGPTAEQEAAQNERIQKLVDADEQLTGLERGVLQELWESDYADPNQKVADHKRGDNAYKAWRTKTHNGCGLATNGNFVSLRYARAEVVKTDAIYDCLMEATRERIAMYQKFQSEFAAKRVSEESWAAIGFRDAQSDTSTVAPKAAALNPAQVERIRQLGKEDQQVDTEKQKLFTLLEAAGDKNRTFVVDEAQVAWLRQRELDCGVAPASGRSRPEAYEWSAAIVVSDPKFNCMIGKDRERVGLFQQAEKEMSAGKISGGTWAALGVGAK